MTEFTLEMIQATKSARDELKYVAIQIENSGYQDASLWREEDRKVLSALLAKVKMAVATLTDRGAE